ncbi:MAG: mechanosensitive ion channel [Gammaproteobacteria bacterium]
MSKVSRPPRSALQSLAVLLLCFALVPAVAQEPPSGGEADASRAAIEARIKRLEEAGDVSGELKTQVLERYRRALDALADAERYAATADEYAAVAQGAPDRLKALRAAAEAPPPTSAVDLADRVGQPLADLEQQLLQEQSALGLEDTKLADLSKRVEAATNGPATARARITEVQRELDDLDAAAQAAPPPGEAASLTRARAALRGARVTALNAELRMLNQLIVTAPIRAELRTAQRDALLAQLEVQRARVQAFEELINRRRLAEAEAASAQAEQAQQQAAGKHPLLEAAAERNAELGAQLRDTAQSLERVTAKSNAAAAEVKRLESDFQSTKQKIELAGLSQALGQALRERRRSLPNLRDLHRGATEREQLIADASLRQIRDRDERDQLKPLDDTVDRLLAQAADVGPGLRPELRESLRQRLELLDKAIAGQDTYVRALSELEFNQQQLIDVVTRYDDFLAERLLWIRSTAPIDRKMLGSLPEQAGKLLSPANWFDVWATLVRETLDNPTWLLPMALFAFLLSRRRRILRALAETGEHLGSPTTDSILYTVQALALTVLAALPWPILALTLGYELRLSDQATEFTKAVGQGLSWLPAQIFFIEFFRALCHRSGLAAVHFRWPATSIQYLRRRLLELMTVLVPAAFLSVTLFNYFHLVGIASILVFVVIEIALAVFFYRVMHPAGPVLQRYVQRNPSSLIVKLRMVWFPTSFLLPLVLAVYAAMGYLFAAGMLTSRLISTMWFMFTLVVVHALAARWLLVTRRRLAYQTALERRAAARKAAEADGARSALEDLRGDVEEPRVDLAALDVETRKLLNLGMSIALVLGLYAIWSSVLPAFGILERIELWQHTVTLDGQDVAQPITLQDVVLALVVVVATVVLARSMPTFFEVVVLPRFAVSPGSRYAFTTLMGYVIAAAGAIWAFNIIGANWSQLQWLVAALGVGIGFGLQEIVANFISGLIILFERPIRVGDWVTVGDTDGVVTRIQIRATTIRNWDRKELLVPNKEFITGRLLNWSLSDNVTRIVIRVGRTRAQGPAARGDLRRLRRQLARSHPAPVPGVARTPVEGDQRGQPYRHAKIRRRRHHHSVSAARRASRHQPTARRPAAPAGSRRVGQARGAVTAGA